MQLHTTSATSTLTPGLDSRAESSHLSPGQSLAELLGDLRSSQGFAYLPQELLRFLGQHNTRRMLKRHGYELGVQDAKKTLSQGAPQPDKTSVAFFISALRNLLDVNQVTTSYARHEQSHDTALEWSCTLAFGSYLSLEQRINYENTALWLTTGYAAGYLHTCLGKHYCITYAKATEGSAIVYYFGAQPCLSLQDFDHDLLLPGFVIHTANTPDNAQLAAPAPTAAPAPAMPALMLQEKSELVQIIRHVAPTDASVLLLGESGVGKSMIARDVHTLSLRALQSWVEINCAALPEQLMESELFGVERGAFSGAMQSRKGKFEQAHGGTLFLDEIGLLSLSAQSKLLRVLQSGEFERLGSNTTIYADVRIIAATNEDLFQRVQEGKFREDLYYRLNVFPIEVPPLRSRKNEIPHLVALITKRFADKYKKTIYRCTPQAREMLLGHDWPGNIRELNNVLERAVILCPNASEIHTTHLGDLRGHPRTHLRPSALPAAPTLAPTPAATTHSTPAPSRTAHSQPSIQALADQIIESGAGQLHTFKDALARAAMRHSQGNISHAAAILGITRGQLSYQIKKMPDWSEEEQQA